MKKKWMRSICAVLLVALIVPVSTAYAYTLTIESIVVGEEGTVNFDKEMRYKLLSTYQCVACTYRTLFYDEILWHQDGSDPNGHVTRNLIWPDSTVRTLHKNKVTVMQGEDATYYALAVLEPEVDADGKHYYVSYRRDGGPLMQAPKEKNYGEIAAIIIDNVTKDTTLQFYYSLDELTEAPDELPENVFTDVAADAWYKSSVDKVSAAGLMKGIGDNKFAPGLSMTFGQALSLAYNIHAKDSGAPPLKSTGAWYMPYYEYCLNNGIITPSQVPQEKLTRIITRYEMVAILDKAIPPERMEPVKTVTAIPDVEENTENGGIVYKWYRAGIVNGDQTGKFNGNSAISRAEIATILCNIYQL